MVSGHLLNLSNQYLDYLDAVSAHAAYWADGAFAQFLVATTFAEQDDFVRAREAVLPEMWAPATATAAANADPASESTKE